MNIYSEETGEHLRKRTSSTYTRRQAIEDGQLIDVTDVARELMQDFPIPIAMTDAVLKALSPHGTREAREERRVRDLLHAAGVAVASRLPLLERSAFEITLGRRTLSLVIEFHEADEGGLVGTIMVPRSGRDQR